MTAGASRPRAHPGLPSPVAVRRAVGAATFSRAEAYVHAGRVGPIHRTPDGSMLSAEVTGNASAPYQTVVSLLPDGTFYGECSCPVAVDCKHAAAVLLAAHAARQAPAAQPAEPAWERALAPLVREQQRDAGEPIALQLELRRITQPSGAPGRLRLQARPVVRGRSGRWVRTGVSWRELSYGYDYQRRSEAHRAALAALYRSHQPPGYYTYADTPVFLDEYGPTLWPLLREAVGAGVELVAAKGTPERIELLEEPAEAQLNLERSEAEGAATLRPQFLIAGAAVPAADAALLGNPVHGVAVVTESGLRLAPLREPLSRAATRFVEDDPVRIPAADLDRFVREYYPVVRRTVPVRSDSVELPAISGPTLHLRASFRAGHRLRLRWSFLYDVAGQPQHHGLRADAATGRDPAAEERLLQQVDLPQFLLGDDGAPVEQLDLAGIEAAHVADGVLPRLAELPGVVVEIVGSVPDYRRSESAPVVRVATTDTDDPDWFGLGVVVEIDGERVPFRELFVALARGEEDLLLDSGTYFSLDRPELDRLRALIEEAGGLQDRAAGEIRVSAYQVGLWEELEELGVVGEQSERWASTVRRLLAREPVDPAPLPGGLAAQLRHYQLDGFRWLAFLWDAGLGGILADDMGLGKTLQTLAAVCHVKEQGRLTAPVLVVAPTSVVSGWAAEAARFAPDLRVVTVTRTERKARAELAAHVAGADVVITSYALFRLDEAAYAQQPWSALVLDEAQMVKNHQAKTYKAARRLPAPFKLAITGTPLENSLMDLWSLLSIVAPGVFPDPKVFGEQYRVPIERGGNPERLDALRRRVRPFILRRTKEQVAAELPPKQEQILTVELGPRHRRIYDTHLQRERRKILGLLDDLDKNRFTILRSLTLLRQLSLDPALVDEEYAGVGSSKAEAFLEQLEEVVDGGHRALVFSQFTSFLKRVRERLEEEGIDYCYLDGTTRNRGRRIEEFKTGTAPVFLISLKAGGFGLNLTEADYCFVLDPWWNPATEAQAVDRTHRIGQRRTVMVYRLVAAGTIEEKVMALKARKQDLFDRVIDDDALLSSPLSAEDIRGLLVE